MKIIIEIELEGDDAETLGGELAFEVIDEILDEGTIQDAIDERAASDELDVRVKSATNHWEGAKS